MTRYAIVVATFALAGGCAMDPSRVEDDFGASVRQMVAAQIYDPEAASAPDPDGPALLDGEAAATGVDGYREAAARDPGEQPGITLRID